jgi:hypothetical protein
MQVTYEISNNIYRLFSSQRQKYRVALQQALADIQQNFNIVKSVSYKRNTTKLVVTYFQDAYTEATERAFFSILDQYYTRADTLK